ncbi:MAG: serine/threonine protein kinase [Myxococcales bacterium]|nr:serine/threonine protein kinase [Myxococcales bacterium]
MKPEALIGETLDDRFRITDIIGGGGMSTVYRGEPVDGRPPVAIKVLRSHLLTQGDQRERFEREAEALFGLHHPHIVSVLDFGVRDKTPFLVMELLEGASLDIHADGHALPMDEALTIGRQVLEGLALAHSKGVVHRDVKAENVFLVDGNAKLLDFGLVKFVNDTEWTNHTELTATGDVFGTPAYMSPEQAMGKGIDARADVYSMGVLLFELVTGRWPFVYESQAEMMHAHVAEPAPTIESILPDAKFPAGLSPLIARALAKKPDERFRDATEMLKALLTVMEGESDGETSPWEAVDDKGKADPLLDRARDAMHRVVEHPLAQRLSQSPAVQKGEALLASIPPKVVELHGQVPWPPRRLLLSVALLGAAAGIIAGAIVGALL